MSTRCPNSSAEIGTRSSTPWNMAEKSSSGGSSSGAKPYPVIPSRAHAMVDGRFLPGFEGEWETELDAALGPGITREYVHYDIALETEFEGALVDAMVGALKAEDPGARPVPYTLSGGTDAKSFSRLGIRGFGFAPLRLPADLDFSGMFNGFDERVPLDALRFGTRVLDRVLDAC